MNCGSRNSVWWLRQRRISRVRGMKMRARAPMAIPAIAPGDRSFGETLSNEELVSLLGFEVPIEGALMATTLEAAPSIQVHWFIEKLPRS